MPVCRACVSRSSAWTLLSPTRSATPFTVPAAAAVTAPKAAAPALPMAEKTLFAALSVFFSSGPIWVIVSLKDLFRPSLAFSASSSSWVMSFRVFCALASLMRYPSVWVLFSPHFFAESDTAPLSASTTFFCCSIWVFRLLARVSAFCWADVFASKALVSALRSACITRRLRCASLSADLNCFSPSMAMVVLISRVAIYHSPPSLCVFSLKRIASRCARTWIASRRKPGLSRRMSPMLSPATSPCT